MRKPSSLVLRLAAVLALSGPAAGEEAALLFAYEIDRGEAPAFDAAYKEHLAWHEDKNDALVWYAWTVIAGSRPGAFVDGTFGALFEAIDARPALAEDGAHFAHVVAPHAVATAQLAFSLWREASTAFPLEERRPSRFVDVFKVTPAPGREAALRAAVERLAAKPRAPGLAPLTWYRDAGGGPSPAYLAMAARASWSELGGRGGSLAAVLAAAYGAEGPELAAILKEVAAAESEVWAYRPDLAYFPKGR